MDGVPATGMTAPVRAVLDRAFRDRPLPRIERTERIEAGNRKRTVRITIADGPDLVLQYVSGDPARPITEGALSRAVAGRTPLPIPPIVACGTLGGGSYLLREWVTGTALSEVFGSLDPPTRIETTRTLGESLGRVHAALEFDAFGPLADFESAFAGRSMPGSEGSRERRSRGRRPRGPSRGTTGWETSSSTAPTRGPGTGRGRNSPRSSTGSRPEAPTGSSRSRKPSTCSPTGTTRASRTATLAPAPTLTPTPTPASGMCAELRAPLTETTEWTARRSARPSTRGTWRACRSPMRTGTSAAGSIASARPSVQRSIRGER